MTDADRPITSMTSTYHATRQRANSVPESSKPTLPRLLDFNSHAPEATSAPSWHISNVATASDHHISNDLSQASEQIQPSAIPHWQRELARSRVGGRTSRASSIISTRTRLTVQSEDARSVELEAGGQSFRISRDGAVVTNTTAPPPYPGPPLHQVDEVSDEEELLSGRDSIDTLREDTTNVADTPLALQSLPIRTHIPPTPSDDENTSGLTRKTSPFELPRRFRQVLNTWYGVPTTPAGPSKPLPRSKGSATFLRRTQSDSSSLANVNLWDPHCSSTDTDDSSSSDESTDSEGHRAQKTNPSNDVPLLKSRHRHRHSHSHRHRRRNKDKPPAQLLPSASIPESSASTPLLNTSSIPTQSTPPIHLHHLLHNQDIIYRQQLRDRDHTIETLTLQLASRERALNDALAKIAEVEADTERKVERARNEVEDMWEGRWREFVGVLRGVVIGAEGSLNGGGGEGGVGTEKVSGDGPDVRRRDDFSKTLKTAAQSNEVNDEDVDDDLNDSGVMLHMRS